MDPTFLYYVQVDWCNHMANLFKRDSRSKLDFDLFGDVVVFGTGHKVRLFYEAILLPQRFLHRTDYSLSIVTILIWMNSLFNHESCQFFHLYHKLFFLVGKNHQQLSFLI